MFSPQINEMLKRIPGVYALYRRIPRRQLFLSTYAELRKLSSDELLSMMRNDSHRIEKAVYNEILYKSKYSDYVVRRNRVGTIFKLLEERGVKDDPSIVWSRYIYDHFEQLQVEFIQKESREPEGFDPGKVEDFINFLSSRRSVRVWADEQPPMQILRKVALSMIDAARWAPNSGNLQAWRFRIITDQREKELLKGIKENHVVKAPLLIFVGMNGRAFRVTGSFVSSLPVDAGAAIMQMILLAHECGLGTCWNHFAQDLINSRRANKTIYEAFSGALRLPPDIVPIALLAVGLPKFIPPKPLRAEVENLLIR